VWLTSADTTPPDDSHELSGHVLSYRQIFKRNEIDSPREIIDSVTGRLQEDMGSSHGKLFPKYNRFSFRCQCSELTILSYDHYINFTHQQHLERPPSLQLPYIAILIEHEG